MLHSKTDSSRSGKKYAVCNLRIFYFCKFAQNNFVCPVPNAVHPGNPFHLIFRFHLLGNALPLGQLRNKLLLHFLRLAVNFFQMGVQRVFHKHDGIKCLTMIP